MSAPLSVKSKSLPFSCILSGRDDLGSTGTPCCTAQRNSTWREQKMRMSSCLHKTFVIGITEFTWAGVRPQLFATSMTTGSVTSSPFPIEEYAWKHTPYSSQTLLSSAWHSRGWNSTCGCTKKTLSFALVSHLSLASTLHVIPVELQGGFCKSALVLSCVPACSLRHLWPSVSLDCAAPPVWPSSELGVLESNIN